MIKRINFTGRPCWNVTRPTCKTSRRPWLQSRLQSLGSFLCWCSCFGAGCEKGGFQEVWYWQKAASEGTIFKDLAEGESWLTESGRPKKHDPKWRHINEKFMSEHQAGTQWVLKVSTKKTANLFSCMWQVAKKDVKSALESYARKNFRIPERSLQASVSECRFVWLVFFFLRGHGHPVCPQTRLATARSVSKHQSDASGHSWPEHGLHYVALSATHLSKHIISKHVFP